jgi:hypothetical protein
MAPGAGTPAGFLVYGSDTDDGRRIRSVLADDSYLAREALIHVLAGPVRLALDEGLHVCGSPAGDRS